MEWNVFIYNSNKRKIESFNIFDHRKFNEDVQKSLKKFKDKNEFIKILKSDLMYYFWSKYEWEIILAPWCGKNIEEDAIKIDVYEQVMNNWNIFVDYVWSNKIKS